MNSLKFGSLPAFLQQKNERSGDGGMLNFDLVDSNNNMVERCCELVLEPVGHSRIASFMIQIQCRKSNDQAAMCCWARRSETSLLVEICLHHLVCKWLNPAIAPASRRSTCGGTLTTRHRKPCRSHGKAWFKVSSKLASEMKQKGKLLL